MREASIRTMSHRLGGSDPVAVQISALNGDNVGPDGAGSLWHAGPSVLEPLETVPVDRALMRPRHAYRRTWSPRFETISTASVTT